MALWSGNIATNAVQAHRLALAFVLACPLLAAIPFTAELIQHAVEINLGMYDSLEGAREVEKSDWRALVGWLKVAALNFTLYGFTRYVASGYNTAHAHRMDGPSLATFGAYFTFSMAFAAWDIFVSPSLIDGLGESWRGPTQVTMFVLGLIVGGYLMAWGVAAAWGHRSIGPTRSVSIMHGHLPWAIGLNILAMLPLMVLHYLLAGMAIGQPMWIVWLMMLLDSLVVAVLAAVLASAQYLAAMRAAEAKSVELTPETGPTD